MFRGGSTRDGEETEKELEDAGMDIVFASSLPLLSSVTAYCRLLSTLRVFRARAGWPRTGDGGDGANRARLVNDRLSDGLCRMATTPLQAKIHVRTVDR